MEKMIELYSEEYDFHFCRIDEIDDVINFIDTYWKKNHILVLSRDLLNWQYFDKKRERYNFSIARNRRNNEIHAILGFIPVSQFDSEESTRAIFGALWKTREDVAPAGLGLLVDYYIRKELNPVFWGGVGNSEDACKNLTTEIREMDHYFLLNPLCNEYIIAKNVEKYRNNNLLNKEQGNCYNITLQDYLSLPEDSILFKNLYCMKTKNYYINRYFLHPAYKYHFLAIKENDNVIALVVYRKCSVFNSSCLRIVDYIGNLSALEKASGSLVSLLINERSEYIDFLVGNADCKSIEKAGFINKNKTEDVIIPNWFEPFVQENKPLTYSFWSADPGFKPIMFRGDSDQDRPNLPWW